MSPIWTWLRLLAAQRYTCRRQVQCRRVLNWIVQPNVVSDETVAQLRAGIEVHPCIPESGTCQQAAMSSDTPPGGQSMMLCLASSKLPVDRHALVGQRRVPAPNTWTQAGNVTAPVEALVSSWQVAAMNLSPALFPVRPPPLMPSASRLKMVPSERAAHGFIHPPPAQAPSRRCTNEDRSKVGPRSCWRPPMNRIGIGTDLWTGGRAVPSSNRRLVSVPLPENRHCVTGPRRCQ